MAALLAREFEAEVIAVHVAAAPTVATLSGIPAPPRPIPSEAALWEFLRPDFPDAAVTAQVCLGTVWDRLVHVAAVEEADVIVMATRGHDSLSDRILGSNTERVVRHAPCPVLVA